MSNVSVHIYQQRNHIYGIETRKNSKFYQTNKQLMVKSGITLWVPQI